MTTKAEPKSPLFPAYYFHKDLPPVCVPSMDGYLALGPGWHDTPDQTKWGAEKVKAKKVEEPVAVVKEVDDFATPDDLPDLPPDAASEDDLAEAAEIHSITVAAIVAQVGDIDAKAKLTRMRWLETLNPKFKGGRPNALKAIDGRLKVVK